MKATNLTKKLITVFVILTIFSTGLFADKMTIKGKILSTNIGKTKIYIVKTENSDSYVLSVLDDDLIEDYFEEAKSGKRGDNPPPKPDEKFKKPADAKSVNEKNIVIGEIKNEGNYYERPKDKKVEIVGGNIHKKPKNRYPEIEMEDITKYLNQTVILEGYLDDDSGVFLVTGISIPKTEKQKSNKKNKKNTQPEPIKPTVIF